MKKYYGYVAVANEEEAERSIKTVTSHGARLVKGPLKWILGKLFIIVMAPWAKHLVYDVIVFHCPTEELAYSCITKDVMENGGYRI